MKRILNELGIYQPKEIMLSDSPDLHPGINEFASQRLHAFITGRKDERFDYVKCLASVSRQFGAVGKEAGRARNVGRPGDRRASFLYAETQMTEVTNVSKLTLFDDGQYLELDLATRRNLELCETCRTKEKKGTLLWVLDRTKTSAGARMLRRWVEQPLVNAYSIWQTSKSRCGALLVVHDEGRAFGAAAPRA